MSSQTLRIAAAQMEARTGDVDFNLAQVEKLVRDAAKQGAEWIIVPEMFASGNGFHPDMHNALLPLEGRPRQLLLDLAKELGVTVGGTFIAIRDGHVYNTFVLAHANGELRYHDKDQPTMWESAFYVGGNDDGYLPDTPTPSGTLDLGVAICWELIRTRTATRLRDKVDLVVGGSGWWDQPEDAPPAVRKLGAYMREMIHKTPGKFARLVGAPVVHASHAGRFDVFRLEDGKTPFRSVFHGETQIVSATGEILARLAQTDGQGVIVADVEVGKIAPSEKIPERFWIFDMPEPTLKVWDQHGLIGLNYYLHTTMPMVRGEALVEDWSAPTFDR